MSTIIIFHFGPLEHYPPIQNLLLYLGASPDIEKVRCITTYGSLAPIQFGKKVSIHRPGKQSKNKLTLWSSYLLYNLLGIVFLILKRPSKLMYFESLSAFPVYLYKKYLNTSAHIYIHYHEYTTAEEYSRSSPIRKYFHKKEKYLYRRATWISQTNEKRMEKFLADEDIQLNRHIHHFMPNYPLSSWSRPNRSWESGKTLKVVYVGYSLTKEGSYLEEVVKFLKSSSIPIEINIYCIKANDYSRSFEEEEDNFKLSLHKAVPYDQLAEILSQHHVGLILYKAKTPNYIFNAPNKLFEYLSCGLDVWYPKEMQGIHAHDSQEQPKVLRVDYNTLNFNLEDMLMTSSYKKKIEYTAENIYVKLKDHFVQ